MRGKIKKGVARAACHPILIFIRIVMHSPPSTRASYADLLVQKV